MISRTIPLKALIPLLFAALVGSPRAGLTIEPASSTRPEAGTRIVGSDEAPAVLSIVPWQDRELGTAPGQIAPPVGSVLDDALRPVDRAEMQREIEYLKVLQQRSPDTENTR
jgi:sensor domain CHASE-containing protein